MNINDEPASQVFRSLTKFTDKSNQKLCCGSIVTPVEMTAVLVEQRPHPSDIPVEAKNRSNDSHLPNDHGIYQPPSIHVHTYPNLTNIAPFGNNAFSRLIHLMLAVPPSLPAGSSFNANRICNLLTGDRTCIDRS